MGKTAYTKRLACSNGTTVLLGDEALESVSKSSSITELFWKVRYSQIAPWTDVIYCDSSPGCREIIQVLPDGTTVHSSATGTSITLEHSAGSNASDRAHFLFEAHQVKNSMLSVERYYFDVHFTVICEWKNYFCEKLKDLIIHFTILFFRIILISELSSIVIF